MFGITLTSHNVKVVCNQWLPRPEVIIVVTLLLLVEKGNNRHERCSRVLIVW